MKKIEICLDDEVYEKVVGITNYENLKNQHLQTGRPTNFTVEEFIVGSVIQELNKIENLSNLINKLHSFEKIKYPPYQNNFKYILKKLGMKQNDLAEMTKIDTGDLSAILNNKKALTLNWFLRIWISLGCPDIEDCFIYEKE